MVLTSHLLVLHPQSYPEVLTVAFEAVPTPAWVAPTAETPRDVETGGVPVTAVSPKLTFVHI